MRRHLLRFATKSSNRAQKHGLQQERRRGSRRAQSASARGGLAPSLKMVPPAKITAESRSQAGAAWPRAGPETIVRLAACICTRVKRRSLCCSRCARWCLALRSAFRRRRELIFAGASDLWLRPEFLEILLEIKGCSQIRFSRNGPGNKTRALLFTRRNKHKKLLTMANALRPASQTAPDRRPQSRKMTGNVTETAAKWNQRWCESAHTPKLKTHHL